MSVRSPLGAVSHSASVELPSGSPLGLDQSRTKADRRTVAAIAGLLLGTFVIAISAANTVSLLPESVRAGFSIPANMAGAFGNAGIDLHSGGTIALLAIIFASYVVIVQSAQQLSGRTVLLLIAAVQLFVFLGPPLVSTDVFSYQAYARMGATYHANPYLNGPYAIFSDPIFPYIGAKWSYIPSAYGPVFTIFSYLIAPFSVASSVVAFKAVAVASSAVIVTLVWRLARLRGVEPVRAVALVGLNPLLVIYGIGGGHNDLMMLAISTGALYLIVANRGRWGGGLLILATAIKLTAGLLVPFAFAAGGGAAGQRRRRDIVIGLIIGAVSVMAVSGAVFGVGALNLFPTVMRSQSEGDWHSIPGLIGALGPNLAGHIVGYMLDAVFLGVTIWLLREVWRQKMDWINAAGWSTWVMLATAGSLLPWYVSWLLPLAAISTDRRLLRPTLWLTGVVLVLQMLQFAGNGIFGYMPSSGLGMGI